MGVVYFLIGLLLPITYQLVKVIRKRLAKRKTLKPVVRVDDLKQLRTEIGELNQTVSELRDDMQKLKEVNDESQKRNELLFPQNFDKDPEEGKTVFVKNGEEKPYETIDWRSR